jgi:hypothetical protein
MKMNPNPINWLLIIGMAYVLTSCATALTPNGTGIVYTSTVSENHSPAVPLEADAKPIKIGKAASYNILGLVLFGASGMNDAMRNGDIIKVHHVDVKKVSVLGLYSKRTLIIYGE